MTISLDGSVGVTFPSGAVGNSALMSGTSQATTSGTNIDFTGIPSWVKRITVSFAGVSKNSTGNILIQIGSGSIVTSGYASSAFYTTTGSSNAAITNAFLVTVGGSGATTLYHGQAVLTLISGNTWVYSGNIATTVNVLGALSGGFIALGGSLDRIRITTNTSDTFTAGTINILYE